MPIVLDGSLGITTPDLASGPVAGTTANFSGNVTLGASVLETPVGSAPSYTCRAWVNFDGTTTPPTIRASGNVSSVARNGTGDYTVNFTTAIPDANYAAVASNKFLDNNGTTFIAPLGTSTAAACRLLVVGTGNNATNVEAVHLGIFR
jgi:hypothetical protein